MTRLQEGSIVEIIFPNKNLKMLSKEDSESMAGRGLQISWEEG
jgi:hypothetical protein